MLKIIDFKCTYDTFPGINKDILADTDIRFPEVHFSGEMMARLSLSIKNAENSLFCRLPFCHTLEAEAMGGNVNYGNENFGPRAGEYICTMTEEILSLPDIDFSTGRINETLKACDILIKAGEKVVLEVSGPYTILNTLIDPIQIYKTMRKNPKLMEDIFNKLEHQILGFIKAAREVGVEYISFADSSGGVNILGDKMTRQTMEMFTYDFLKKALEITEEKIILVLCPKITLALLGTGKAKLIDHKMSSEMTYEKACIELIGKVKIAGQMCIKNSKYILNNQIFKEIKLL